MSTRKQTAPVYLTFQVWNPCSQFSDPKYVITMLASAPGRKGATPLMGTVLSEKVDMRSFGPHRSWLRNVSFAVWVHCTGGSPSPILANLSKLASSSNLGTRMFTRTCIWSGVWYNFHVSSNRLVANRKPKKNNNLHCRMFISHKPNRLSLIQ